jgi:hypothetical protein
MNRIIFDRTIEQAKLLNESRSPPNNRDIKFEALIGELVNKLKQTIEEATGVIKNSQFKDMGTKEILEALEFPTGASPENSVVEEDSEFDEDSPVSEDSDMSNASGYTAGPGEAGTQPGTPLTAAGRRFFSGVRPPARVGRGRRFPVSNFRALPNRRRGGVEDDEDEQSEPEDGRKELEELKSGEALIEEVGKKIATIVSEYNGVISKILEATQPQGKFATRNSVAQTNISFLGQILKDVAQPLRQLAFELSSSKYPEVQNYFNLITNFVQIVESSPPFQKVNFDAYKHAKVDFQGMNQALVVDGKSYMLTLKSYSERLRFSVAKLLKQAQSLIYNAGMSRNPAYYEGARDLLETKIRDARTLLTKVQEEIRLVATRPPLSKEQKANALRALDEGVKVAEASVLPPILNQYAVEEANPRPEGRYQPFVPIPGKPRGAPSVFAERGDVPAQARAIAQEARGAVLEQEQAEQQQGPLAEYGLHIIGDVSRLTESQVNAVLKKEFGNRIFKLGLTEPARRDILMDIIEGTSIEDKSDELFPQDRPAQAPAPAGPTKLTITPLGERLLSEVAPIEKIPRYLGPLGEAPPQKPLELTDGLEGMKGTELTKYAKSKIPGFKVTKPNKGGRKSDEDIRAELRAQGISGSGRKKKCEGGSGGLADLLSTKEQQQHNRAGRPVSNEQAIHAEMIALQERWQELCNPPHATDIGLLYPFYKKDPANKYIFADMLRNENSQKNPVKNALGADYSLLQGKIGGPTVYPKQPKKPARRKVITQAEATQNILEGKGRRKNKKALHKLNFNDEKNEMFD